MLHKSRQLGNDSQKDVLHSDALVYRDTTISESGNIYKKTINFCVHYCKFIYRIFGDERIVPTYFAQVQLVIRVTV